MSAPRRTGNTRTLEIELFVEGFKISVVNNKYKFPFQVLLRDFFKNRTGGTAEDLFCLQSQVEREDCLYPPAECITDVLHYVFQPVRGFQEDNYLPELSDAGKLGGPGVFLYGQPAVIVELFDMQA